jgi:nucleotide-binding universal stress UspA family protein
MRHFRPKRILVPTDFSALATRALQHAVLIARRFGAPLEALYADTFLPPIDYIEIPSAAYVDGIPQLKESTEKRLQAWMEEHVPPGIAIEGRVEVESPVHAIVTAASSGRCELIVMGTHGRSGWRRALLGSVTEAVLREVDCGILTVRAGAEGAPADYRKIVCPVNYTDIARRSLEHAASFAEAFDAELIIANVIEQDSVSTHADAVERLRAWVPADISARCDYKELVLHGHPAEEVIDFARRLQADLIVVGAQHRRFSDTTIIGTTTERITRHAFCPVLVLASKVSAEQKENDQAAAGQQA